MPAHEAPVVRLFQLLENLVLLERPFTLKEATAHGGLPKPTTHRMLAQLESAGLLQREPDGHRYAPTRRLLLFSDAVMRNSMGQSTRHVILQKLVADVGETCNLTALAGAEVSYLDRVEAAFPLRIDLRPGSRVPLHCSASGKLFLASMSSGRRDALLRAFPLIAHTDTTLVSRVALEAEFVHIRRNGYSVDAEESIVGLVCVAVPVVAPDAKRSAEVRCALALQAPQARMSLEQALRKVGRLQEAAKALAATL